MKRYHTAMIIPVFFLYALSAYAADPLATVKADVGKVLDVVRNANLGTEAKKEKLRYYYQQMFDTEELSRQSLGADWRKLSPAQQQEFIHLYGRLLERDYMDKILAYNNQKIVYIRQIVLSDTRAEVLTKVITPSNEIPINYRMILAGGIWKVYDVVAEGVSLILTYRDQFREILANNTSAQMLEILKKKLRNDRLQD
jgi:phospholipid transport system substrate-binding protein